MFDGKTLYVGGDGPGNYTKIKDAIDDSSDGDTVFAYSGTYKENLIVNKCNSPTQMQQPKETTTHATISIN